MFAPASQAACGMGDDRSLLLTRKLPRRARAQGVAWAFEGRVSDAGPELGRRSPTEFVSNTRRHGNLAVEGARGPYPPSPPLSWGIAPRRPPRRIGNAPSAPRALTGHARVSHSGFRALLPRGSAARFCGIGLSRGDGAPSCNTRHTGHSQRASCTDEALAQCRRRKAYSPQTW